MHLRHEEAQGMRQADSGDLVVGKQEGCLESGSESRQARQTNRIVWRTHSISSVVLSLILHLLQLSFVPVLV